MVEERKFCIGCQQRTLEPVWDLGVQQVVDFPTAAGQTTRPKAPLVLGRCYVCELVQLMHTVPPSSLFTDAFWYRSGINESMIAALRDITATAKELVELRSGDAVLDIGSNDGTLLSLYEIDGLTRVGVDPAPVDDIVALHRVREFFTAEAVVPYAMQYQVITAIAMFYDLEDPHRFLSDIRKVLAPGGVFLVQMNTLSGMYEQSAVDNICHEHLTYYTLRTFKRLLGQHGLVATHAWRNDVNGGSVRIAVRHEAMGYDTSHFEAALQHEERQLVNTYSRFMQFRGEINAARNKVRRVLEEAEKPIYLYGASTRGATLLQYFFNTPGECLFAGAAERDVKKIGRYYLDTQIPIVGEEEARAKAKTFFVLPWHFWVNILEREMDWCLAGGTLIRPLPVPTVHGPKSTRLIQ